MRLLVATAAILATLLAAGPAAAITRRQANAAALAALRPQNVHSHTGVVVYGLPQPLRKGQAVFELGDPKGSGPFRLRVRPLDRRAWLYWEDPAWGERFSHLTFLLLVDDRTGKVLARRALSFWPVVDGRDAPFAVAGRLDRRYQVFSNVPGGSTAPRRVVQRSPFSFSARDGTIDGVPVAAPAGSLAGECVLSIGLRRDPQAASDFAGLSELTGALADAGTGLQAFSVVSGDRLNEPDGATLTTAVGTAVAKKGCKDILIYIDGHGSPAPDPARVLVGYSYRSRGTNRDGTENWEATPRWVTATHLRKLLRRFKTTGFKLKIDACYSGRFKDLVGHSEFPNLHVLETASSSTEFSYFFLASVKKKDGTVVNSTTDNPGNVLIDDPQHPGQKIPDRADGRSEFTNGNLAALRTFFTTPFLVDSATSTGGNLFAEALTYGFEHSRDQDFAAQQGMTHPQSFSDQPPFPEMPAAPGATVTLGSKLDAPADTGHSSQQDEDFWPLFFGYCQAHPDDPLCRHNGARQAAPTGNATMPADGQILAIRVKGIAQASGISGDPGPLTQIHFSDLRPQGDGSVKVIATSQAFDLPSSGDPNQVTTFTPTNLCVQAGDILTLSTEGGFDPTYYPNGVVFQVFGHVAGSQIAYYTQHNGVMNGAQFSGTAVGDTELLMQWDLGTGSHAANVCPGGTGG